MVVREGVSHAWALYKRLQLLLTSGYLASQWHVIMGYFGRVMGYFGVWWPVVLG